MNPDQRIGLIDGSTDSNSRTFHVVLDDDALVQLDELVAVSTKLPGGGTITHYGIVTELYSRFEGAEMPSDTARVMDSTLPAEHIRRAEVSVLRVQPERFVAPHAGTTVYRAHDEHRSIALFEDEMKHGKLPIGLDLGGSPVYADMRFVDGRAGGHVSISGISGVATKTSYALFLLYQLLETDRGVDLLGGRSERENARALVFNTKGEDLLHVDRPNAEFAVRSDEKGKWKALGVDEPQPFRSVRLYAPARSEETTVAHVETRDMKHVHAYGWTPEQFIRDQLLQFCFTANDDRNTQVGFVEQQVRIQLLRHLRRLEGDSSGAVVILHTAPADVGYNPDRLADHAPREAKAGAGTVIRTFADLVDFVDNMAAEDEERAKAWFGRTQIGTHYAFLRRLMALRKRMGHLVRCGVTPVSTANARLHVVDIARLHDDGQRFVVGALLNQVWREKQGTGRQPLRFVVLDELNKYAPAQGFSPLKELLVDIAERGRSLGVLLIGAQQAASAVAPALPRNASLKVAGRLDAGELDAYRFLSPKLRERASRFMPGTMVVSQPIVPEPIPVRFPYPPFATNPDEAKPDQVAEQKTVDSIEKSLKAFGGPKIDL